MSGGGKQTPFLRSHSEKIRGVMGWMGTVVLKGAKVAPGHLISGDFKDVN